MNSEIEKLYPFLLITERLFTAGGGIIFYYIHLLMYTNGLGHVIYAVKKIGVHILPNSIGQIVPPEDLPKKPHFL